MATINGSDITENVPLVAFLKSLSRYEEANGSGSVSAKLENLAGRIEQQGDALSYDEIDAIAQEVQSYFMEVQ